MCELVIYDNGSTDGTKNFLSTQDINLLGSPVNVGVAVARNRCIEFCLAVQKYDLICFLHNDMLFPTHWLEDSLNIYSSLPPFSVLGIANILDPDCLSLTQNEIDKISIAGRENKIAFANLEPRFYPIKLFKEIGLLDEIYQQSEAEDVDFNIRINEAGYNITATNLVNVFHLLGYTRLKIDGNKELRQMNYNTAIEKHGEVKFKFFNSAKRKIFFIDGTPYTLYGC